MKTNQIYNEDCLTGMKKLKGNCIDLIVTDPPYGYSFMNKEWDSQVPSVDIWKECFRVLKDGAFCFVMSAPRQDVQVQMIHNLHEAGFKMEFTPLYWAYASGFPKASNVSKMVDKRNGIETMDSLNLNGSYAGFQPKPAVEIILVAMKPISEKTYVDQALKNKKGITWLDDCRVPYESKEDFNKTDRPNCHNTDYSDKTVVGFKKDGSNKFSINNQGRFPANLLVSNDVLNDGNVIRGKPSLKNKGTYHFSVGENAKGKANCFNQQDEYGSFSRYFDLDKWYINKLPNNVKKTFPFLITPKASSSEKKDGCDGLEKKQMYKCDGSGNSLECFESDKREGHEDFGRSPRQNIHPTVKPIKLMQYLITLGSRENDLILDPFMGSGTTAIASRKLTRNFIGFELSEEYHKIALARIKDELAQKKLGEVL